MITQELDLNMVPGTVPPVINVSQFDTGARTFVFTLYNGATLFTGPVASCRIEGIKPDKKGFSYNASYSNGVVTADCTEQMTAVAGNVICEIRLLENNEKILGTLNFTLCVERSPLNSDTDISQTELPAIIDLARSHEQAAANSANQASSSAAQAANSASQASASAAQTEAIKTEMQNHLNQIDQNAADIRGLRRDVNTNASNINGLRRDLETNVNDIRHDLETNVNDLDTKISKNANDIVNLDKRVYKNECNIRLNTNRISDLEITAKDFNTRIAKNTEDISKLRTDVDTNARNIKRIQDLIFKDTTGKLVVKQGGLQCLQGNLTVVGKTIDIDDLLRNSVFISRIIAMIDSELGELTVEQGKLSVLQGNLTMRNIL